MKKLTKLSLVLILTLVSLPMFADATPADANTIISAPFDDATIVNADRLETTAFDATKTAALSLDDARSHNMTAAFVDEPFNASPGRLLGDQFIAPIVNRSIADEIVAVLQHFAPAGSHDSALALHAAETPPEPTYQRLVLDPAAAVSPPKTLIVSGYPVIDPNEALAAWTAPLLGADTLRAAAAATTVHSAVMKVGEVAAVTPPVIDTRFSLY